MVEYLALYGNPGLATSHQELQEAHAVLVRLATVANVGRLSVGVHINAAPTKSVTTLRVDIVVGAKI